MTEQEQEQPSYSSSAEEEEVPLEKRMFSWATALSVGVVGAAVGAMVHSQ